MNIYLKLKTLNDGIEGMKKANQQQQPKEVRE